uniref:RCC1 domain containing 1 n=1 Tax=Anas zonorhyncha TaxID=75864 RepID=A0A8B9UXU5_9AVES
MRAVAAGGWHSASISGEGLGAGGGGAGSAGPAAPCGPGQGRCWCPVPSSTRLLPRGLSRALTRAAPCVLAEGGDLYMWGWNESGQLALPSKAVAEEQEQDEDAGTGAAEPPPPREQPGAAFISIQAFPALLDLPQDVEVDAVSCGSRHTAAVTRECPVGGWGQQPRWWGRCRLMGAVLVQETGSSTPGAGVNTGSWAMGTTPALTGPGAWSTWWQRGCGHRRWCAGPGTPTCASWSSEGHEAVPRPSLCAWSKGRQRRALLLPHRAALGPWRSGRGWADTMGGFPPPPPPGPQLRPRSCAAASGSWGCTSDKDRAGLHGFIKSLFVTAAVVLRVAYTYRCPGAPAPLGTGKVYRKKAGAEDPGPALSPSWPPG